MYCTRELHAAIYGDRLHTREQLKQHVMLFDKTLVVSQGDVVRGYTNDFVRDLDFLYSQGLLCEVQIDVEADIAFHPSEIPISPSLRPFVVGDILVRHVVAEASDPDCDVVGVYEFSHTHPPTSVPGLAKKSSVETAMSVGLGMVPIPDDTCAFEDILNFKTDLRDKEWGYRRFLKALATQSKTASEIRDEIEWMLNEYAKAMKLHRLKTKQTYVGVLWNRPTFR